MSTFRKVIQWWWLALVLFVWVALWIWVFHANFERQQANGTTSETAEAARKAKEEAAREAAYQAQQAEFARAKEEAERHRDTDASVWLQIRKPHWTHPEYSSTTWSFSLNNKSDHVAFNDIHFKTRYFAPSGTEFKPLFGELFSHVGISINKTSPNYSHNILGNGA